VTESTFPPLPVSKRARVIFEVTRTACALLAVVLNTATLCVVLTR
jgi:hypothetical protein